VYISWAKILQQTHSSTARLDESGWLCVFHWSNSVKMFFSLVTHASLCMILSFCLWFCDSDSTIKPKRLKLKLSQLTQRQFLAIPRPPINIRSKGQKVKSQGHRVTKCKRIDASCLDIGIATLNSRLGDRMADVSYAPTGWRKKWGQPISLQIFWKLHDQIAGKLANFCNIICWTQSLTFFLFKNYIALWRHLAKSQLLCDAQIYFCTV